MITTSNPAKPTAAIVAIAYSAVAAPSSSRSSFRAAATLTDIVRPVLAEQVKSDSMP
jgi:hypothetical protein